jgi:hypothetical protein
MTSDATEPQSSPGAQPGALHKADDAWSYQCGRCGGCCINRGILITPFDVARLADGLGIPEGQVLARYGHPSIPILKHKADGACIFFEHGRGCTVHRHRPGVCRLYPLGRHLTVDRKIFYIEVEPVKGSPGVYGKSGAVRDYLRSQGADLDEPAYALLNAFLDEALVCAQRADALAVLDDRVHFVWQGEAGFVPASVFDLTSYVDPIPMGAPVDQLAAHLDHLRELCGLNLPPARQAVLNNDDDGRAMLFRLIQTTAFIAVSLGLAPGFSQIDAPPDEGPALPDPGPPILA